MDTTATVSNWPTLWTILGGIATLFVTLTTASGRKLPIISNERIAFFVVVAIGVFMCATSGIGRSQTLFGWTHPITLAGIALGLLAGILVMAELVRVRLPFIANDRAALFAITAIIVVKIAIDALTLFIRV